MRDGDDGDLIVVQTMAGLTRLLLGGVGAVLLGATATLLAGSGLWRPGLLSVPFWIIALGATSVSAPFLFLALAAPERRVALDIEGRRIEERWSSRIGGRARGIGFDEVAGIDVRRDAATEGREVWHVVARLTKASRPLHLGSHDSAGAAAALRDRLVAAGLPAGSR